MFLIVSLALSFPLSSGSLRLLLPVRAFRAPASIYPFSGAVPPVSAGFHINLVVIPFPDRKFVFLSGDPFLILRQFFIASDPDLVT